MPSDDEFRRVAEDVRALMRSLMRDIREGVDQAMRDSRHTSRSVSEEARHAARQAARQARQQFKQEFRSWRREGGNNHDAAGHHPWAWPVATDEHRPPPPPIFRPRPPRPAKPPRPAIRHRRDSSTVLGILALVLGLSWLAAATHVVAVPWRAGLAVALVLLGASMVVTARTDWALSRRSWPVFAGAALIMVLLAANASVDWPTFGPYEAHYTSWNDVPAVVSNTAGPITLDLAALTGAPPPGEHLRVNGGFGPVTITLPANAAVDLQASTGAGSISIDGRTETSGVGQRLRRRLGPPGATSLLTLVVRDTAGPVTINQASS